jgi:MFS superfamily sulfate permease-like transporter
LFKNISSDLPASIVVFLVAMPLCLGIALASGAPLFSGIISGIIGGIVVGAFSGSPLGVSGPAAGLAVIVLTAINDLGGFEIFLVAVVLAGIIQIILGLSKAGIIAYFFPSSVIHGMLAGIGILIFLKQVPLAFGYKPGKEEGIFQPLITMLDHINPTILIISVVGLALLLIWETSFMKKMKFTKVIQGPLMAVIAGIVLASIFLGQDPESIPLKHMVAVPVPESFEAFKSNFTTPDFSQILNGNVIFTAFVIAIVASIETLLCVEASDKQDPQKRVTPTNRELIAQGIGNVTAGLIGGLPVTQVIVRSSTNMQAGGKTKLSAILHGIFLMISVIAIPTLLNKIPLSALAAILLVVGYKLAKPKLFIKLYKEGLEQFLPFVITIVGIVATDLLMGIGMGVATSILILLRNNYKVPYTITNCKKGETITITLAEEVTFLNKASVLKTLTNVPEGAKVIIDAQNSVFIHHDVIEIIEDFKVNASFRNIDVEIIDLYKNKLEEPLEHIKVTR